MNLTFKESIDFSEFAEGKAHEIAEDIIDRYNLSTQQGIKLALKQAAYAGYCYGKGHQ